VKHLLLKDFLTDETRPAGAGRTAFNSEEKRSGEIMPDHRRSGAWITLAPPKYWRIQAE